MEGIDTVFWGIGKPDALVDPSSPSYVPPTSEVEEEFASITMNAILASLNEQLDLDRSLTYLKQFGIHVLRYKLRDGVDGMKEGQVISPHMFNTLAALAKKEDHGQAAVKGHVLLEQG